MRREHLHLTVLVLLSLLLQSALSDDADDYVRLGETRAARAAMGSGDAITMIDDDDYSGSDPTPTPVLPVAPSCTLPKDVVSPSTVTGTEEELRRKALCHAACVADQVSSLSVSNKRVLAGYPVWNVVPDSFLIPRSETLQTGLDCQQYKYREILDCERGCLTRYSGTSSNQCGSTCRNECRAECPDPLCGDPPQGCLCRTEYVSPCGLNCAKNRCNTGCTKHDNLITQVYPSSANPDAPPLLSQSDQSPSQYCVNVTPPSGTDLQEVSALLFRVEDIDAGNFSFFWIRELKLNLEDFAGRVVNVSFAVATPRGLSEYSPATIIRVSRGGGTQFPGQLNGFNHSAAPDERRRFFQHHTINLVWERPDNYELITDYTITLSNSLGSTCRTRTTFTAGPNATSFTLQARDPGSPPISMCSYKITVQVNPRRDGDLSHAKFIDLLSYPTPNSTHIHTTCPRVFSREEGNYIYNFTWRVDFSEAVLSGVNNFEVNIFQLNPQGNVRGDIIFRTASRRFIPENDKYSYENISRVSPLNDANERYRLTVTVVYNSQPRQPSSISANCDMVHTPVPPPDNIENITVTWQNVTVAYPTGERTVTVRVNFTWTEPNVPYGSLKNYDVWFDRDLLLPGDNRILPREPIPASARDSSAFHSFITNDLTFTVFLQMRARNALGLPAEPVSEWRTIAINISAIPPGVVTDIRLNNISHVITTGAAGPMVTITGEVSWAEPKGSVTRYHLWIRERPLKPNEDPSEVVRVESASTNINKNFELKNNSLDVFIQIRAVNQFGRGNWSDAIQIRRIRSPPPPGNITAVISENIRVVSLGNGLSRVSGEVELKWEVPDSSTELEDAMVTYQSWVGTEALDQFETPPSPPKTFEVGGVNGNADFAVETGNINNITVVVQMRSTSAANTTRSRRQVDINHESGPWSDPMILPVVIPPKSALPAILGSSLSVSAFILIILLVLLVLLCVICVKSWLFKRKLEKEPQNLVMLGKDPRKPSFIPLAKIEGMEPLLDDWEVPASEVIVEDRLGEGAFGEVFKGIIKGPLHNPKISSVLKQTIGIPVAIKLLKPTASGKEKADFLAEIDMMKKIAEGYNPHIVNMVGCVTLQEPLCLITEFVPFGDLLSFLRSNRKKTTRMRRRDKFRQAQVQEQTQLEQVILEQAQMEQTQEEHAQVERQGPNQEGAAAPYLETRDEYSHLMPSEAQLQSVEVQVAQQSELTQSEPTPAPYLEPKNEYSRLDPKPAAQEEEEEEEDLYPDLGDLESNDLIQFAYQIASGMEYLASLNIVHRDLACRNILLGEDKKLKITDFGMSREVEEVYVKKTKGRLPLKWMAIESIISREFTTASDVWAYGVVLWEIGTLGGFPYPTISNQDLLMMLKQGYRLEKPDNCGPEVYEIMLECWNEDPEDRPTFSQLRTKFGTLILAGKDDLYIDLQVDEMKPYYLVKEEEEKKDGSSSSSSSEESIASIEQIKEKNSDKETLKPKPSNPYVESPSQMTQPSTSTANPRKPPELTEEPIEEERDVDEPIDPELEESPYADQLPSRPIPRPGNQITAPVVVEQPAETAVNGVPVSMFRPEKITSPECNQHSNPYTDEPSTKCNGPTPVQ